MANLIYAGLMSLDGYIADETGKFDWAMPSEEVHRFINDLERPIGTHLYGRQLYEVMASWETIETTADQPAFILDYAKIWKSADKIVFSTTLESVSSARTRIERDFDLGLVRNLKKKSGHDLSIGGPHLAAQAIRAGLVDEYHLFITPVLVGAGKPFFPQDVGLNLNLIDECRFANGMVHLHYGTVT
jgi:dihydrofolate reductase